MYRYDYEWAYYTQRWKISQEFRFQEFPLFPIFSKVLMGDLIPKGKLRRAGNNVTVFMKGPGWAPRVSILFEVTVSVARQLFFPTCPPLLTG